MANQSEITSPDAGKSRLRMGAVATGKNVADPTPKILAVPVGTSRESILFILSRYA
jgi:hypothetical protein